ncbi:hypothetical protein D0863_13711 [Hortaea werneckii]|uniref:PHD-type domain-containing protein n=1 Tax=Hortaea werneckii TaxID=91943 RepID=A0A3M7CR94_HORWE|nr:hypothetical protein D0863_13711 [Hortaea werneckii]
MSFSLSSLLNPAPAGENPDQQQDNQQQQQQPNNAAGPTYQYGYSAPDNRRPSIELPPPEAGRPVSSQSPTLEQYQVASRSPEQRRASLVPTAATSSSGVTLPPLQNVQEPRNSGPGVTGEGPHVQEGESEREPVQHMNAQDPISAADRPSADAASTALAKREPDPTSTTSTPMDARRSAQPEEGQTLKPLAFLKSEHSFPRMQSPLRESSVPVPSTEPATDEKPATAPSKKRPAPTKKGTATVSKKKKTTASAAAPANKKRKVDRASETPSARKPSTLKATATGSSPAPSSIRSRSPAADGEEEEEDEEFDEDEDVEGSGEFYCICRKPDNGTFMIGCDGTCDDWYHGKCVGVEERDKNLIDAYYCPACTSKGEGLTTWKRICRRKGCRMPARIAGRGAKGGEKSGGSKYCSEECGVLYFREMVARTRGKEEQGRNRTSRRKGSVLSAQQQAFQEEEEDVGAKGGILAAGEIKALITSAKNVEDFRKLGEGVLSPPATPDRKEDKSSNIKDEANAAPAFTDAEATALETIHRQKDEAHRRHGLLKDRMKFVTLVKQAAARTASERELKPKEYCGYDPRLEWTEAQFAQWRASPAGKQALELETLDIADDSTGGEHTTTTTSAVENGDVPMSNTHSSSNSADPDSTTADQYTDTTTLLPLSATTTTTICDRKKCARHLEWGKLVVDDLRFEMADNSDRMRGLAKAEREVRERAALRAKGAGGIGEGVVVVHEMPSPLLGEGGEGVGEGQEGDGMEGVVESGVRAEGGVAVSNKEGEAAVEVVQSVEHDKGGLETSSLAVDHPDLAVTASTATAQMDGAGGGEAMDVDPA